MMTRTRPERTRTPTKTRTLTQTRMTTASSTTTKVSRALPPPHPPWRSCLCFSLTPFVLFFLVAVSCGAVSCGAVSCGA
eukprot:2455287-Rhodomonas_salina.1